MGKPDANLQIRVYLTRMWGRVGATSELLKPLHEALRQYVMSGRKLHADDIPVLSPGEGKTKLGRLLLPWNIASSSEPQQRRSA